MKLENHVCQPLIPAKDKNIVRLPNIHIQRASGDGAKGTFRVQVDGKDINIIKDGRFIDFFLPEGTHIIDISCDNVFPVTRSVKIHNEKEKLTFYTRCTFNTIELFQIS